MLSKEEIEQSLEKWLQDHGFDSYKLGQIPKPDLMVIIRKLLSELNDLVHENKKISDDKAVLLEGTKLAVDAKIKELQDRLINDKYVSENDVNITLSNEILEKWKLEATDQPRISEEAQKIELHKIVQEELDESDGRILTLIGELQELRGRYEDLSLRCEEQEADIANLSEELRLAKDDIEFIEDRSQKRYQRAVNSESQMFDSFRERDVLKEENKKLREAIGHIHKRMFTTDISGLMRVIEECKVMVDCHIWSDDSLKENKE